MSSDAFAAALGKGALLQRPSFGEAIRTGVIFGVVEAITPVIGWAAGRAASARSRSRAAWPISPGARGVSQWCADPVSEQAGPKDVDVNVPRVAPDLWQLRL